ncbi:ATP-binding protein [Virgibacillus sp. W0430]|uniref:ATP-binding protein n=1 Tax=Virgibacillus sp. W0430 TaxID=3391580 RepID=UPI003F455761
MFWRSVVGKLAITILLLVSFVLFILTILLLEFFEGFHIQEAEKGMMQTATKVSVLVEQHDEKALIMETTERVKNPASRVVILYKDGTIWASDTTNKELLELDANWLQNNEAINQAMTNSEPFNKQIIIPENDVEIMIVADPLETKKGIVLVYQSLDVVDQTKAETTKIIFVAAGIAIILTTVFAFFLSTRITSPLIKMREAAFDLTRGEFNTKVPILTHDEIGELAIAFNRMGRQLKFHINALRQEKEQLSGIVTSMADGVITLNRTGEMIITNPPAKKFIQDWYYENGRVFDEMNPLLPEELNQILQKVINGEKEVLQELSLQGRNWVMIMTPLYDQSYVRGAVAVIRDMTEERQMDKLRKDFIANVSHELRTPIALLQGYSEAIVDDIADTKEAKNELAQIIHEESLRMGRLVNELLDIGRMEAGHIQLQLESQNVDNFVNRVFKKFERAAAENNIHLQLTKKIRKDEAVFDADRLEQVLTNLIDNALNHTSDNGNVHIFVENIEEMLYIEVTDNGSGIPEEDLSFVFERFYKADKSRTRNNKKKGTGLGLAIAKHIIEAHAGTIAVKSKQNEGTAFSLTIPQNKKE